MPFITFNEYIKAERTYRYKAAVIKKQQTNSVADLAIEQKFTLEDKKYDVIFNWYKPNNRTDHDNITATGKKFILDGLVRAGSLKDDSPKYIGNFKDNFIVDKTRNYISCMVEFVELEKTNCVVNNSGYDNDFKCTCCGSKTILGYCTNGCDD